MNAEKTSGVYHVEAETTFKAKVEKFSFGWTVCNLNLLTRSHRSPLFYAQDAKIKWALNLTSRSDCVIVDLILVECEEKNYAVKYELYAYNSRKLLIKSLIRQADVNKASLNPVDCLSICREELNKSEDRLRLMCVMEVSSLEAIEKCDTPGAWSDVDTQSPAVTSPSTVQQAGGWSEFVGTLKTGAPSPSVVQQARVKSEIVGTQSPAVTSPSTVQQVGGWSEFVGTLKTLAPSPSTVQQGGAKSEIVGTQSPAVTSPSTVQQVGGWSEFVSTLKTAVPSPSAVQRAGVKSEIVGTRNPAVTSPSTVQQAGGWSEFVNTLKTAVPSPSTVQQAGANGDITGTQNPAVTSPSTVQQAGGWSEFVNTLKTAVPSPSTVQQAGANGDITGTQNPAVTSPSTVQQAGGWSEFVGTLKTLAPSPSTVQQAGGKSEIVCTQSRAVTTTSTVQQPGGWSEFVSTLKTAVPSPPPVQQVSTNVPPIKESSIVTFSVNGTLFEANRATIAKTCPTLIKTNEEPIKIDMRPEIFKQLLNFILTKEANVAEFAAELLHPATNYEFQELKDLCDETLSSNITVENCIDLVILADLYSAPKLKKGTLRFIADNASNLTDKPEWNKLKSMHKNLFDQVVHSIINCM